MTERVKELFDTLMCNYDFPAVFAEGLAEFLIDEGYKLQQTGTWRLETDEEEPNPMFKLVVCPTCGKTANNTYNFCPECGTKMFKEIN